MNRIVLKVNLFGFTGVQIDLYHLDSRFISDDKQYLHFNTQKAKDEFLIYSRRKLAITVNSLRVPDKEYYQAAQSIKHNFERLEYTPLPVAVVNVAVARLAAAETVYAENSVHPA